MSRVLLLEPDRLLADTYVRAFRFHHYEVTACASAQAAIMAADTNRPDVVIIELQLTEHSGIEFLYEFCSYDDWQNIPIIIHSFVSPGEFAMSQQLLKAELGVQAYLYKPASSLHDLLRASSAVLSASPV